MQIFDLYPSRVYVHNLKNQQYIDHTLSLVNDIAKAESKVNDCSVRQGWQSSKELYTHPHFAILADYVLNLTKTTVLKNNHKLKPYVTSMWLNVHGQHGFNHVHVHSGAWYSGVVYLQVTEKSGQIMFTDPRPGADMSFHHRRIEKDTSAVRAKVGDIILFPAFLPHLVEPNCDTVERISISFNMELLDV
jgi:uncharacterized protein (TIGR02466 family)